MKGFISRNLGNYLNNDFVCIYDATICKNNLDKIIEKIDDKFQHIIIDLNCVNDEEVLIEFIQHLKKIKNFQIIVIFYQYTNFLKLYELQVFDILAVNKLEDIEKEINNVINNPMQINSKLLGNSLKTKVKKIIAFINVEYCSYTSFLIKNLLKKNQRMYLLETNNVNTSLTNTYYIENACKLDCTQENIYSLLDMLPNHLDYLIIDFGKLNTFNRQLFLDIYGQLDLVYFVDTDNVMTKKSKYYQDCLNLIKEEDNHILLKIPHWKNKLKYLNCIKNVNYQIKKIK